MIARLCLCLITMLLLCVSIHAQEIEATLSGHKPSQAFTVYDDQSNDLLKVRGDGNIGITEDNPAFRLHLANGGILAIGKLGTGPSLPTIPTDACLIWHSRKAAFRAGNMNAATSQDQHIGTYSFGGGYKPNASGVASVSLGYMCTAGSTGSVALGQTTHATGTASFASGLNSEASGNFSTAMGSAVSTNNKKGSFIIGDASTTTVKRALTTDRFYARFANGYILYTKSDLSTGMYAYSGSTSWSSVSDSTRKEHFLAADGESFLGNFRGLRLGSWNFKGDGRRHYGPMAQEWFAAFGRDGIGTIGDDTTLATADVDGILCIAIQALEKRTVELQSAVSELSTMQDEIVRLHEQVSALESQLAISQQNSKRIDALADMVRYLQKEVPDIRDAHTSLLIQEDTQ